MINRYFFDTEFIEYPNTIDLISIGMVSHDGREYYAISSEFDASKADDWVHKNVIDILEPDVERKPLAQIRQEILEFALPETNPEFWAYYAAYDWVVFCWIFGRMIDLPEGYPMFCRDLKQVMDRLDLTKDKLGIEDPEGAHNALVDARWNKDLYYLMHSGQDKIDRLRALCEDGEDA